MKNAWLIVIVITAVLVVAGIMFMNKSKNNPEEIVDISNPSTQISESVENQDVQETPVTIPGYQIDSNKSTASYTVHKDFVSKADIDVTGTVALEGNFDYSLDGEPSALGEFKVDLRNLVSGTSQRDDDLKGMYIESDTYPLATFVISSIEIDPALATVENMEIKFKLNGELKVHGVSKPLTFDVVATRSENTIKGTANAEISGPDFGITMPNILNMYVVNDKINLDIVFVANKVN